MNQAQPASSRRTLAWGATAASLVLAVAPGFQALRSGLTPSYDGSLAVLTATLIAIIWYTQYTYESLQYARATVDIQRRSARTSLATGLLDELRWLDGILAQIHSHGGTATFDPLSHPLLETALAQSSVFSPQTAAKLSGFHALLRDVRALMSTYALKQSGMTVEARGELNRWIRIKAYFALKYLPALVDALKEDGGAISDSVPLESFSGAGVPPLPDSAFGARAV